MYFLHVALDCIDLKRLVATTNNLAYIRLFSRVPFHVHVKIALLCEAFEAHAADVTLFSRVPIDVNPEITCCACRVLTSWYGTLIGLDILVGQEVFTIRGAKLGFKGAVLVWTNKRLVIVVSENMITKALGMKCDKITVAKGTLVPGGI